MNKDESPRVPKPVVIIAGLLVLLLLGWHWLVPSFVHGGPGDRGLNAVANNLRILEGAKEQWALEHHQTNDALPTIADLAPYLKEGNRILERAKERWYQDQKAIGGLPTPVDLASYLKIGEFIKPAAGEIYTINPVGEWITAKLARKMYRYEAGTLLTVTNF